MKAIDFKERNVIFAKDQPEYLSLPAFKNYSEQGEVISCWQFSLKERLKILFGAKLWVSIMTFNKPLSPSFFTIKKSDLFNNK